MKIIILYFIISLLFYKTNADFDFKVYDESSLNIFPQYSSNAFCSFDVLSWVIPLDGEDILSMAVSYSFQSKNSTHYLYSLNIYNIPIGSQSYEVIIQDTNFVSHSYNINLVCNSFDNSVDIQIIGGIFYDPIFGYALLVNTSGIPSYTSLDMKFGANQIYSTSSYGSYRVYGITYYGFTLDTNITGPINLSINVYPNIIKNYTIQNYFHDYSDENLLVDYYPTLIEDKITLIGKQLYPYYTIQAKNSNKGDPFFNFFFLTNGIPSTFTPISESNGITTYFSSFYSLYSTTGPYSLYVQNNNTRTKVFEKTLNIIDVSTTVYYQNDVSMNFMKEDIFLNIGISSEQSYLLNKIKMGTGLITRYFEYPYGFTSSGTGGDNSNYNINISVPVSNYLKKIPLQIFESQLFYYEIIDNNNTIANDPVFTSYEFIYLTNSKYILKLNIISNECGVGFISFNLLEYKRISQYRVSGDSFNGQYEIPIDFDLDLGFNYIMLYDLCGKTTQIENNGFIQNLPFQQLSVPFLNYIDFSIYDIKNISYLNNNLDVRKNSISNIMYFNYEGSNIKTPFSLRLPILSSFGSSGYFTNEYYASWNSTINKFQIEFVVPKNSRLGPFQFSITNGLLNSVPSSFFDDSDQLIISKSNFDPLGPIFSKVEKIPFENGKFGWSLTISDPINGFDNGTITVTGSEDNSIYKFDLFPTNRTSGNSTEGVYEIIISTTPLLCVNQDYIITFVKLWDTGAQYSVFELASPALYHNPNQMNNPFRLFFDDSTINKYTINCTDTVQDLSGPSLSKLVASSNSIDVGLPDRSISFNLQVEHLNVGINIYAQGPIIYLTAEGFDLVECISVLVNYTNTFESAYYTCSVDLPIGFGQNLGVFSIGVYGIISNHGIFAGYSSEMLKSLSFPYKVFTTYSLNQPLLLESGRASSKGGEYFIYGRSLDDVDKLSITNIVTNQVTNYTISNSQKYALSSVLSIPNLEPTLNSFYVSVTSKSGFTSNKLLVSPFLFLDFIPDPPLPTNSPQQCSGSPMCGGPTHGVCNTQTGCICIYPWKGKSCQDKVIEPEQPVVDPNEPSTGINIPDDTDDNGNPVNNIHYKSLISLYSLREVDINGNTVKNYKFNDNWEFNQISTLISNYKTNVTTIDNSFNTTISTTLEWFNQSKVITFADQDLEMNANSIKYSIEISKYPFTNSLNYLQLVMSATLTSTSSTSCSSKDFGDTTTGDNSNYINIQIDNKSLYGRFIKRGIVDNNKVVALSNEILDYKLNAISTPSQSQRYVGITIPQFKERAIIDPDFSVLLNSDSASSKSNSVCKSKGLSGAKIAGIVIGSVAFVAIIVISVSYHFKKKKDAQKLKDTISNKLKEMNNNNSTNTPTV